MYGKAPYYIQLNLKNPDCLALTQSYDEIMRNILKQKGKNSNLSKYITFGEIEKEKTHNMLTITFNLCVSLKIDVQLAIELTDELFLLVKTQIESFVQTKLFWCLHFKQEELTIEKLPYVISELQMQRQETLRQYIKAL